MSLFFDAGVVVLSILSVSIIMVPLFGAQKKSVLLSQQLARYADDLYQNTDDNQRKEKIRTMVKMSRSWFASFLILLVSPWFALKSGFGICKSKTKQKEDKDRRLSELTFKTMFYSNPVTITLALGVSLVVFLIGVIAIFSLITIISFYTKDDYKLSRFNSVKPSQQVTNSISTIYNFYLNNKFVRT